MGVGFSRFFFFSNSGMTFNPGRAQRIKKELALLSTDPPPGLALCSTGEKGGSEEDGAKENATSTTHASASRQNNNNKGESVQFDVRMTPPHESIYAGGTFVLEVTLTTNYPFEAPLVRFKTRIFHPNIDTGGRICLDSLKLPPQGGWKPSLNVSQVLSQIMILLSEPGLGDPLMPDVAELYKNDREEYTRVAKEWVGLYATIRTGSGGEEEAAVASGEPKRLKSSSTSASSISS